MKKEIKLPNEKIEECFKEFFTVEYIDEKYQSHLILCQDRPQAESEYIQALKQGYTPTLRTYAG